MPSADFCAAIRRPFDLLSRFRDTAQTSRGKTDSLPHPPPDLRFASLVDMDFVVDWPLVRRSRLVSGSCSSVPAFAPRFLQTPPHDDALALRYPFTSTRLGRGLSPPSCRPSPAHNLSPPPGLCVFFNGFIWRRIVCQDRITTEAQSPQRAAQRRFFRWCRGPDRDAVTHVLPITQRQLWVILCVRLCALCVSVVQTIPNPCKKFACDV